MKLGRGSGPRALNATQPARMARNPAFYATRESTAQLADLRGPRASAYPGRYRGSARAVARMLHAIQGALDRHGTLVARDVDRSVRMEQSGFGRRSRAIQGTSRRMARTFRADDR